MKIINPNTGAVATKSILCGILASMILLVIYFTVLSLVSGWSFAQNQFVTYWYFIVSLVVGFGIQIALYQYIKGLVHSGQGIGKVVGVSGTASTSKHGFLLRALFGEFGANFRNDRTRDICRAVSS